MTRALCAGILIAGSAQLLGLPATQASPPPPPATPVCKYCEGPPPAPTPIPTLAATVVATQSHAVAVSLSPAHVHRGQQTAMAVIAAASDKVTIVVQYSHGKPVTFRAQVGVTGKLVKRWKVPKSTPTGKATVKVEVDGKGKPYSATVSFVVLR